LLGWIENKYWHGPALYSELLRCLPPFKGAGGLELYFWMTQNNAPNLPLDCRRGCRVIWATPSHMAFLLINEL